LAAQKPIRIASRKSRLALVQAEIARKLLETAFPSGRFEIVTFDTFGDRNPSMEALRLSRGVFVKELERALLTRKADLAVHSLKDLPTESTPGLVHAAVLPREDPSDALVTRHGAPIERLPAGAKIGTSSLRRRAFLQSAFPALKVVDLRGNLDSRIEALLAPKSPFHGIVVAAAGLRRLFGDRPRFRVQPLSTAIVPPAPGQGAICLQAREADSRVLKMASQIDDPHARTATRAERAILRRLGGGCNVPIAALAEFEGGLLKLSCWVASPDGSRVVSDQAIGVAEDVEAIAAGLEVMLKNRGASEVIEEIRSLHPTSARLESPRASNHNHRRRWSARKTAGRRR
jgi:hydroxymethylbilane synthase